jgi:prepilin-type N-terminal cleavage/methylation domain-containing protein/prepilin-type processing-associated H-X9-DG protein
MKLQRSENLGRKRGFTLIEIVIVIAIIVVMATLVTTTSKAMLMRARSIESTANLRSLATANILYQLDNGFFCPADDAENNRRWHGRRVSNESVFDPTKGLLSPYLGKSSQVNHCPLLGALIDNKESFEAGTGGYGYNAVYIGGLPGAPFNRATRLRISERIANVGNPSRTVMFTTTAFARAGGIQEYPECEPPFFDYGSGASATQPIPSVHFRADHKALVAWCDGHVTAEAKNASQTSAMSKKFELGWFGPSANNGYWNPRN